MKGLAYDHFAEWFEYLNDDCDYETWSQYFINGLRSLKAGPRGLELGCGSGAFCRALAKAGFSMSGADCSAPMLTEAERRAREEGLNIAYFLTDAASPKAPEKYDFILSPNDCYNYIPQEKFAAAFKGAAKLLKKGGIFWFDVSSAYKLREKIADNIFADDRDEVTYLSFNKLFEKRVEMEVSLFVRRGNVYERFDEKHIQYIHEEKEILSALKGAGFDVLSVEGALGGNKSKSDRLNFICKKI